MNIHQGVSRGDRRWAAAILTLAAVVAAELHLLGAGPLEAAPPPAPPELADPPSIAIAPMPPPPAYASIAERPLFAPTRRPPDSADPTQAEEKPTTVTAPEPLAGRWQLTGIVRTGGLHFALLRDRRQGALLKLNAGDAVEQWRLEQLWPDRAVFTAGGKSTELELYEPEQSATGTRNR